MSPWLWGGLGGAAAVSYEVWVKMHPTWPWYWVAPWGVVSSQLIAVCIYYLLKSESILGGTVIFTLCTATFRVLATVMMGVSIPVGTWVAFGLLVLANIVKGVWR